MEKILIEKYEEVKDFDYSNKEIRERALKPFKYIKDR